MARDLASGLANEITAERLAPILLVKAEPDEGDIRLWSGIGPLTFNGEVYTGAGDLLNVSPIEETQDFRAVNAVFTLSGLPATVPDSGEDVLGAALTANYQERPITLWVGALTDDGQLVDTVLLYAGRMDVMEPEDDGETVTIRVSSESRARSLQGKNERRWTPEDQHLDFPSDKGFDQVAALQDMEIVFGPEAEPAATRSAPRQSGGGTPRGRPSSPRTGPPLASPRGRPSSPVIPGAGRNEPR